jgi:3-oxoadipate enol-lactonase
MKRVLVHGMELATLDQGQGPVLVLVHGFPLDHRMWQAQIPTLSADYRVIVPDLRGFGQSSLAGEMVSMSEYADDVALLLDQLGIVEPVALMGLSMGGYIALEFWRRHRQRVRALVLCDTRAAADSADVAAGRRATADRVLREGPSFLAESMLPRLFAVAAASDVAYVGDTRDVILASDPHAIAAASRGMAERSDFTALLGQIDVPTLVLVGAHDGISPPEEMRGLAAALPQASFVEISAAGHMAPLENPAETNAALLAFLGKATESGTATGS